MSADFINSIGESLFVTIFNLEKYKKDVQGGVRVNITKEFHEVLATILPRKCR